MSPSNSLILVINLKRDEKRRKLVMNQLSGVDFNFIEAIDGTIDDSMGTNLVTSPINAIWLSHIKAYKFFLEKNSDYCLILEDDFDIRRLEVLLNEISKLKMYHPDLVQLGWLETGFDIRLQRMYEGTTYLILRTVNRFSRHSRLVANFTKTKLRSRRASEVPSVTIPDSFLPGAHGYLISRNFAENAIHLNNPTFLAADDFLMALSKMRSFNFMRLRKSLINQVGTSLVGSSRFIRN